MHTFSAQSRWAACCAAAGVMLVASAAQAKVYSVDEAVALSESTGRPIFAVAGSKT